MIRNHGQPPADAAPGPGPAPVTGPETAPAESGIEKLADLVRKELRLLAEKLGEDVIGGPRHPGRDDGFHRITDLETISEQGRESLRDHLISWSPRAGPGRVLLLVCLWNESWHLLDYSLAYRTLEAAARAAAEFAGWAATEAADAGADGAGQQARDWEIRALRTVGRAMSLVTTDAALFKLINLANAARLKEAAEQAVLDTREMASALAALGRPPFEDGSLLAAKLGEIEDSARQDNLFYAAIAYAAEALIDFERWLETAPRLTFGRAAAPLPDRPDRAAEQAMASIGRAIERFRGAQDGVTDRLILSRYEPWERLLAEVSEIVAPSSRHAVREVLVPKRVSVRYMYPFAVEADDATAVLLEESKASSVLFDELRADLDRQLAAVGVQVGGLKALEPTQFFTRGPGLYGGVRVDLPDIKFTHQGSTVPGGYGPAHFKAWLNLSSMGNHCLCIEPEQDLVEPRPHVLYWTLQAATPFAVGATVAVVDRPEATWDGLHSFSRDIITAVAGARFWGIKPGLPVAERFMRGNLHEIVVVRTEGPLGTHPRQIADALDRAVGGRILARSIQRSAATLEEWVRYPPVPRTGSDGRGAASAIAGIPEMGLAGDWCTNTGETTVFGIVAAPTWHTDVYVEGAQFASSWPPRLQLWSSRLKSTIQSLESDGGLHDGAGQLRQVERRVRLHLAQIGTEELTATVAHRRFLDQLLALAGLNRLQGDLEAQLEAAERLTDWFNQKVYEKNEERRREDEEVRKKADQRRQVLLGFIALFGLFELGTFLSLANSTGFHLGSLSFTVQRGSWEDWVMVALFVLAVAVGFYFYNNRVEDLVRKFRSRAATGSKREGRLMSSEIRFRDLRAQTDSSLIEAMYRDVLRPSFDDDELDSLDVVLDGLTEGGSYECWGLCALDGDTPVGCILGYPFLVSRVLLVGYVAVKPGLRGHGIGGMLLEEAKRRWYGKAGLTLVLAEIDDPRHHPAARGIDPARRVAFYARRGTRMIAGPYFQPRLDGEGKNRVYDTFLAVLHGGGGNSVPAPQIATFLREYFTASGEDSDWPLAHDTEGRWLLDWYRDRQEVGLAPIDQYPQVEIPRVPEARTTDRSAK